jgi:hypothetical protein
VPGAAGVLHTTIFSHTPACDKIVEWLAQ